MKQYTWLLVAATVVVSVLADFTDTDWDKVRNVCGGGNSFPFTTSSASASGGSAYTAFECTSDQQCLDKISPQGGASNNFPCKHVTATGKSFCCSISCPANGYTEITNVAPWNPRTCGATGESCSADSLCLKAAGFDKSYCCRGFYCTATTNCAELGSDYVCENYQCKKKCKQTEVAVGSQCLKKIKPGAQGCTDSKQCTGGYSACVAGKCQCHPGIQLKSGKCLGSGVGVSLTCVTGGVPAKDAVGKVIKCISISGISDQTCPANHRCIAGLCCPAPVNICPGGLWQEPYDPSKIGTTLAIGCPDYAMTRTINTQGMTEQYTSEYISVCCPKGCNDYMDVLAADGFCYPRVKLGEACVNDEQCSSYVIGYEDRICVAGKCACPSGWKLEQPAGSDGYCLKDAVVGK